MFEDINKLCQNFPEVVEVLNKMDEYIVEYDKPREELDFKILQQSLVDIENKFLQLKVPQQIIVYLNSKYFYSLGKLKKLIDPLGSQKLFEDALKISSYLKDSRMER